MISFELIQSYFSIQYVRFYNYTLLVLIWSLPSLYTKSYSVKREYYYLNAMKPIIKSIFIFSILYIFLSSQGLLITITSIKGKLLFLLINTVLLFLFSFSRFKFFYQYRTSGKNTRNVIFIGSINQQSLDKFKKESIHYGYNIIRKSNN